MRRNTCDLRLSFIRKKEAIQKRYVLMGARRLLRMGLVLARVWKG